MLDIVRSLREQLSDKGLDSLISYAYADFERLATAPQGALYLMGVSTRNVLGTDHKNAADMQLCIDALEVMYTRPDIGTFVLVAGDRDYIPVLQHLRRQARQVLVAGFRESVSGDLLQNIGQRAIHRRPRPAGARARGRSSKSAAPTASAPRRKAAACASRARGRALGRRPGRPRRHCQAAAESRPAPAAPVAACPAPGRARCAGARRRPPSRRLAEKCPILPPPAA